MLTRRDTWRIDRVQQAGERSCNTDLTASGGHEIKRRFHARRAFVRPASVYVVSVASVYVVCVCVKLLCVVCRLCAGRAGVQKPERCALLLGAASDLGQLCPGKTGGERRGRGAAAHKAALWRFSLR